MKRVVLGLLVPVLLALGIGVPAFAQSSGSATQFSNFICQIDLSVLQLTLPDGTSSLFTFNSNRLCTGTASARNVKLDCQDVIPNWPQGTTASTRNFECTINGDTCNLAPMSTDRNAPLLTATDQNLTVDTTGLAHLTCFYKPQ
jgi:hypothetical protein